MAEVSHELFLQQILFQECPVFEKFSWKMDYSSSLDTHKRQKNISSIIPREYAEVDYDLLLTHFHESSDIGLMLIITVKRYCRL